MPADSSNGKTGPTSADLRALGQRLQSDVKKRYEKEQDRIHGLQWPYEDPRKPEGSFKKGGKVKKTGTYKLHKGEKVVPANKVKQESRDVAMLKKTRFR